MPASRVLFAPAVALILVGCNLTLPQGDCPADIGWEVRPQQRTIHVGQSFTAEAFVLTCGGSKRERASVTWSSTDPAVARVDSLSGRITGVASGSAQVQAQDLPGESGIWSPVSVTVLP